MAGDEQLPVDKARAGQPEAWDALFRRYQLPLYSYVHELVHDRQASLDIVQEAFINAARHIGSLRNDARFGSWLFGIAHQKCIQHWRRYKGDTLHQAEEVEESLEAFEPNDGPTEVLIRKEEEAEFMKLLNDLPLPHRAVLLLHYLEDFSLEEIAEATGSQLGTVKSRLHYAKKGLKKLLAEREQ